MIRPDPGWLAHRRALLDPALLAPPASIPAVDVVGYRPATSVVHRDPVRGTWWHAVGDQCDACPDPVRGDLRDTDP